MAEDEVQPYTSINIKVYINYIKIKDKVNVIFIQSRVDYPLLNPQTERDTWIGAWNFLLTTRVPWLQER